MINFNPTNCIVGPVCSQNHRDMYDFEFKPEPLINISTVTKPIIDTSSCIINNNDDYDEYGNFIPIWKR